MKENLPLSWFHKEIDAPRFRSVNLPLSGLPWVYSAEIPATYNVEELCEQLEVDFSDGFLVRGCGVELANHFSNKGYDAIRTGAEGIVNLNRLSQLSKSVAELVTRGSKQGKVKEIPLTELNMLRVSSFIEQTHYALKPHLQYLFNNSFDSNTRCFVIYATEDKWLGVITVSVSGEDSCHTEMILRNKNAPVGVMESLFFSVMNILREEGCKYFSLGEVPFVKPEEINGTKIKTKTLQEFFLFKSGHFLKYAFNYRGLFDFKNKFNPIWKPVYICATPKLPFLSLIDLFYKTGYLSLSSKEFFANIRSFSDAFNKERQTLLKSRNSL